MIMACDYLLVRVNVDIDVPLFLPIYGQRRLHDLRRIAGREVKEGFRIDGQMNFDSGEEFINDIATIFYAELAITAMRAC